MSDQRGPEYPAPSPQGAGAWFRDELAPAEAPAPPAAPGEAPTVVAPHAGANRPFPPVIRQDPAATYGRMPPVGAAPRTAPGPAPDAYPPQPPPGAPVPGPAPLRRAGG
ncbi:MAG TPA: hypothetical protein VNC22_14145, partial [Sporichthya sp.]|nr:hypothetical protein [Sporichthya sp.]